MNIKDGFPSKERRIALTQPITDGGLFRYNVTDRNGIHLDVSENFAYKDRSTIFSEIIEQYPTDTHYHFLEKL